MAAPPTLRRNVLAEVGLADRFARMDSPIGPLVVAWNGRASRRSRPTTTTPRSPRTTRRGPDDARSRSSAAAAAGERHPSPPRGRPPRPHRARPARAQPSSSRTSGSRRSRSHAARSGRTAGSPPRSAGPRRSGPWGPPSGTTRCRSSCPAIAWSGPTGTIGQYSLGGPENKRTILRSEGLDPDGMEALAARGVRYIGLGHDQDRSASPRATTRSASRTATGSASGRSATAWRWATERARSAGRTRGRCSPPETPAAARAPVSYTPRLGLVDRSKPRSPAHALDRQPRRHLGRPDHRSTSCGARPISASGSRSRRSRRSSWSRSRFAFAGLLLVTIAALRERRTRLDRRAASSSMGR